MFTLPLSHSRSDMSSSWAMAPLRALVPLVLIALLTSACGSTGSGTTGPVTPVATGPVTPVATLGTFDQAVVDQMTGEGWSETEAITLALTKLSVISWDEHTARILESLPTGETVDLTITLTPGGTGDPNALTTTSAETPDGFTFTLAYHIARTARVAGPDLASTNGVAHIALARFVPAQAARGPVLAADGGSGGDVLVTAVVKKGTEAIFDAYWDALKTFLTKAGRLDPFIQTLKSAGSVFDALDLRTKYAALHARIDAAEKCARNPTNPLTIAAYAADPGLLDRLLEQVDDTLRSVKANVAAVYLLNLNEGVADLLKQAPWLGIALGAGGAWAADNFDKDNEARVSALEASIVRCRRYTAVLEVDIRIVPTRLLATMDVHGTIELQALSLPDPTTGEMELSGVKEGELTWRTTPGPLVNCGRTVVSGDGTIRAFVLSGAIGATAADARIELLFDPSPQTELWTEPDCDGDGGSEVTMTNTWLSFFMASHWDDLHPPGAGIDIIGWSFTAADPTTGVIVGQRTYAEQCADLLCTGESTFKLILTPVK